jgi:hypothetical protein
MRKSVVIEIIVLAICAMAAFLLLALFGDFTTDDNIQIKFLGVGTEMSTRLMVLILWCISIFTINSFRQIKIKYSSNVTNLVLLVVSLRLLYFVFSDLMRMTHLKQAILENGGNPANMDNFIIALWTLLALLISTVIITICYFQNVIRQKLSKKN